MESPIIRPLHLFKENGLIPPQGDQVSLGEIFCELVKISSNDDPNIKRFLAEGVVYPNILVPLLEEMEEDVQEPRDVSKASKADSGFLRSIVQTIEKRWYDIEKAEDTAEMRYLERLTQEQERKAQSGDSSEHRSQEPINRNSPASSPSTMMSTVSKVFYGLVRSWVQGIWRVDRVIDFTTGDGGLSANGSSSDGAEGQLSVQSVLPLRCDFSVRAFGWHPYVAKFAIAPQDHTVRIYDMNLGTWSPVVLKHEFQKNIFAMAWKPLSGNTVAVGTRHGILIWHIVKTPAASRGSNGVNTSTYGSMSTMKTPANSLFSNPNASVMSTGFSTMSTNGSVAASSSSAQSTDSGAWCQYLNRFGHSPINALSWSPSGRFLAAGSVHHDHLLVWDVIDEVAVPITQQIPGGISKVLWSPNDEYVAVFSARSNMFRVFHTRNWASEKWSEGIKGPISSACWCGVGASLLAFTVKGDCKVYIVKYEREDGMAEMARRVGGSGWQGRGGPGSSGGSSQSAASGSFPFPWDSAPSTSSGSSSMSGASSSHSASSGAGSSKSKSGSTSSNPSGGSSSSSASSSSIYTSFVGPDGLTSSSLSFVSLNSKSTMSSSASSFKGTLVAIADLSPYTVRQPQNRSHASRAGPAQASSSFSSATTADPAELTYGGVTSYISWDPTSSRLAIGFEDSELIAIFQTNNVHHSTSLHPLGYLRGPPDTILTGMEFRPSFDRGALLAAHFSNGKISFFPLYFKPASFA